MRFNVRWIVDGRSIGTFSFTDYNAAVDDVHFQPIGYKTLFGSSVETWISYDIPKGGEDRY